MHSQYIRIRIAFLNLACLLAGPVMAGTIGTCTDGIRTQTDFRLVTQGAVFDPLPGFVCGPSANSEVRTADGTAAVGVGAATVGASAGAGALAAETGKNAQADAVAEVELEFMLKTVVPGTAFGLLQVSYDVELTTIGAQFGASGGSSASGGAVGRVNVFDLTAGGLSGKQAAGGVPVEHINGLKAFAGVGSVVPFSATAVLVKPDTPYSIYLSVQSFASAAARGSGMNPEGSASADFSAAIALADLFVTPFSESSRYAIEFAIASDPTVQLPGPGVFPAIDPPLSLVPVPAPIGLLASAIALGSFMRRRRARITGRPGSYQARSVGVGPSYPAD